MLFTDISSSRAVRALQKAGFWLSPVAGAKHIRLTNGQRKLTIPRHNPLNPYTLKAIIRDAGLTNQEFKKLL